MYRGKQDLNLLEPNLRSVLLTLQGSYNAALKGRGNVFERGSCQDFHLDYVDATVISALSFEFEERAFLALSIPLVTALWHSSERLSQSQEIMNYFRRGAAIDQTDVLTIFFLGQISFLVAHEFAHLDRGHFSRQLEANELPNDLKTDSECGSLADQAMEIDADGWAVMLNVNHWFVEAGRESVLKAIKAELDEEHEADKLLLMFFMVSVSAALLLWRPLELSKANVYKLSHPPQAARMQRILLTFDMWAGSSHPWLALESTQHVFPALIAAVEDALASMTGAHNWEQQVGFLRTSPGIRYMEALVEQSESIRRR
jgi:hypothetical protein